MKKIAVLFLMITTCACAAPLGSTIDLNANEKAQAVKIAERRQDLQFRIQQAQAAYQAQMNRYGEEGNQLNIDASILCFQLKKAHKLDPGVNYTLDEWKGELVKH